MALKSVIILMVFYNVATSEYVCNQRPEVTLETSPIAAANTDAACKNLVAAIQSVIISNLRKNAAKQPIFNSLAPALIDEIVKNLNCQCPSCKTVTLAYPSQSVPNPASVITNSYANPTANILNGLVAYNSANVPKNILTQILPVSNQCACQNSPCSCKNVANILTGCELPCGCQSPCSCPSNMLTSLSPSIANVLSSLNPCSCQTSPCSCAKTCTCQNSPCTCPVTNLPTCSCQNSPCNCQGATCSCNSPCTCSSLPCSCANTFANVLSRSCSCGSPNTVVGLVNAVNMGTPVTSVLPGLNGKYSELITVLSGVPSCGYNIVG